MLIRVLAETDDRSGFFSGEPDLDRFFHKYAGQNQYRHHLGTTYVCVDDEGRLAGFVTVTAGSVEVDDLPASARRRYPKYPLPVLRIARLAVDRSAQGKGIGSALLRFVLHLSLRMANDFGCVGVIVDAKQPSMKFYQSLGFEAIHVVEGQSGARPAPTVMFLPIGEIAAASRKK